MSVNRYLLHLAKNSTSKFMQGAAVKTRKAAIFGDRVLGASARKSKAQAEVAQRIAKSFPSTSTNRFSKKISAISEREQKASKNARLIAGAVIGTGIVAKKALQPKQNDVYYDSY